MCVGGFGVPWRSILRANEHDTFYFSVISLVAFVVTLTHDQLTLPVDTSTAHPGIVKRWNNFFHPEELRIAGYSEAMGLAGHFWYRRWMAMPHASVCQMVLFSRSRMLSPQQMLWSDVVEMYCWAEKQRKRAKLPQPLEFCLVLFFEWFDSEDQSWSIQDHPRSSTIIQDPMTRLPEGQLEATYGAVCGSRDAPGETGEMTTRIKGQRIGFPKRNNSSKKPWGGSTERLPSLFSALLAKAKPHARLPVAVVRPRKRHSGPFGSPDPDSNKKPVFDHCPCGPTCHCWLWSSR